MAKSERMPATGASAVARLIVEVLVWALLTWGVWLLTLSTVDTEDLFVGGLCALGCGGAAAAARRVYGARWRPSVAALRPVFLLPAAIVAGSIAVLVAPWRRPKGSAEVAEVDIGGAGSSPRASARRAIATLVVSASPSTVVLDADPETGHLVVHAFCDRGPSVLDRYAAR